MGKSGKKPKASPLVGQKRLLQYDGFTRSIQASKKKEYCHEDRLEKRPSAQDESTPYVKPLHGFQSVRKGLTGVSLHDGGFAIRASQDYVPSTIRNRQRGDEGSPTSSSMLPPQPILPPALSQIAQHALLNLPPPNVAPASPPVAPGNLAADELMEEGTPELVCSNQLCSVDREGRHTAVRERPLCPLFRPANEVKTVYMIRHGESEFNAATAMKGTSFSDPQIFDAPLTTKGKAQARALRDALRKLTSSGNVLWVSSPLTRALQTFLLACPHFAGEVDDGRTMQERGCKVVVHSLLSEHCYTTGDVGRPPALLAQQFPQLAVQLGELPEVWWFSPEEAPNCAIKQQLGTRETKPQVRKRTGLFRQWLQSRPEKVVVAFGHSTWFKEFAQLGTNMANCEIKSMKV